MANGEQLRDCQEYDTVTKLYQLYMRRHSHPGSKFIAVSTDVEKLKKRAEEIQEQKMSWFDDNPPYLFSSEYAGKGKTQFLIEWVRIDFIE